MTKHVREVREIEIRALAQDSESQEMIVEGYALKYNEPAVFDIYGEKYTEIIDRNALALTDLKDVPFKYNHSNNVMIMARTRSKTLELIRDEIGLKIVARLANTTAGRDLYELIKRGDIDKMSFAFTVRKDSYDMKTKTRTIMDIDKLFDVSAVDMPAYDSTSISARGYFEAEATNEQKAAEAAELRKALLLKTYL